MSRYDGRDITKIDDKKYQDYLDDKRVKFINVYSTPMLKFPTDKQLNRIQTIKHTWTVGDKYWKLAAKFYNNQKYWWVIAWFNRKPMDTSVNAGDTIFIPASLEQILEYLEV